MCIYRHDAWKGSLVDWKVYFKPEVLATVTVFRTDFKLLPKYQTIPRAERIQNLTMHIFKSFLFISIATAFVLPAVERSSSLIKTWHPVQLSRLESQNAGHPGFSNIVIRDSVLADDIDLVLSDQVNHPLLPGCSGF
tara:strand:- start:183 stop:593 length:411 start_codon:yes stop_codon:yes gene_type:complete